MERGCGLCHVLHVYMTVTVPVPVLIREVSLSQRLNLLLKRLYIHTVSRSPVITAANKMAPIAPPYIGSPLHLVNVATMDCILI